MTAGQTNVVQIVEAGAELRADQRVCGRVQLTSYAVRLEAEDASGDIVDIVSPAGNNRVALDRFAGNAGTRQACFETCAK